MTFDPSYQSRTEDDRPVRSGRFRRLVRIPARDPEVSNAPETDFARATFGSTCLLLCVGLFVEPDLLHAPAVEEAVHHDCETLHLRLPAGCKAVVKEDLPR